MNGLLSSNRLSLSRGRHALAALILLLLIGASAAAQDFRNIASFAVDYNFDSTYETTLEDVFLAPITESTTLQARVQQISGSNRGLTMLSVGPVYVWNPNTYTISLYGIGFDQESKPVHELDLQAYYETADYRLKAAVRGQLYPARDFFYVVPSFGVRANLPRGFGLQTTYFFSRNSNEEISNAVWSELDYRVSDLLTVKLGWTYNVGDDPIREDTSTIDVSGITGATFRLSETVNLRYHFEYFGRTSGVNGIRNLVVVDWRF